MNIEAKKLTTFLSKVRGGEVGPNELKLDFGQTITTSAMNTENTVIVSAEMQPTEFSEYNPVGIVAIDDLKGILSILSGFNKVDINKDNNLWIMKEGGRKVETILTNPEFIKEAPNKDLSFDETIEIEAKKINDFISQARQGKEFILKIRTLPKQLVLESDGKYKFTEIIEAKDAVGGIEVKVGPPFLGPIAEFSGKVTLKLKNNYPVQIVERTAGSSVCVTVAPYMDSVPTEEAPKKEEM